ncbi:hypothetical protein EJB05_32838, partial [Eragrostis curvula]
RPAPIPPVVLSRARFPRRPPPSSSPVPTFLLGVPPAPPHSPVLSNSPTDSPQPRPVPAAPAAGVHRRPSRPAFPWHPPLIRLIRSPSLLSQSPAGGRRRAAPASGCSLPWTQERKLRGRGLGNHIWAMSECSGTSSLNQRRKRRQPNPICSEAPTSDDVSSSAHSNYLDDSPTNFDSESTRSVRRRLCAQPAGLDNQRDEVGTQRHTKRKAKYSTHRLDMLTCSTSGGGPLTCDTLLDGAPDTADDFPMGFAFQSSRPVRRRLATHPSVLQLAIGGVYAIVFDDDYSQCYTLDVEYSQIYYCTLDDEYSNMLYPR